MNPLLRIEDLRKEFGGIVALEGVSFTVIPNIIKAIIGPNGAGKTTIFNIISGIYSPSKGKIWFKEERIDKLSSHLIAMRGISRTFQNVQIFNNMTVLENVMIGCHPWTRSGFFSCVFKTKGNYKEEKKIYSRAMELLEFVGLADKRSLFPSSLTFQQQRLIEIARALATNPELILLDEPAAGLNARETIKIAELIYRIKEEGISILLVEHDMDLVMDISQEIIVLNSGRVIAEGNPREVQNNEKVIATYLGEKEFVKDKKP
ncbi:ABC transporter ATP-binding protein [Candidatus Aerophobetes bacterium]|nr:ABC transporter ATP-binding protein [Candidatus Aerophobetes bacterium]